MRQPELIGCARGGGRKQGPREWIFGASPHRSLPLALVVVESDDKSMCYVLPRGADGGRSSISVQEAGGIRWELMPGTRNVVRFPVELVAKPTSDLLRSVAPDVREVSLVAESFGLDEPPMEVRSASDRAMAERIAATTCWPEDAKAKRAALEAMPKPLVERALLSCPENWLRAALPGLPEKPGPAAH